MAVELRRLREMAVNDTIELAVQGVVGGQQHVHTLHFRYQEVSGTESGLIAAWKAACLASYRAMFSTLDTPATLIRAAQVCGTLPLRAPSEDASGPAAGTRAITADPLPTWVAQVVSERTALAGRSHRGRFFMGGLYEVDSSGTDGNTVPVGNQRAILIQTYLDALLGAFQLTSGTNTTYKLVVHSRTLAAIIGTQCQNSSTPVTGLIRRDLLGSMRSRKPGSGS
jgi:hypothetical protein